MNKTTGLTILALSGSLREGSINSTLLRACTLLAPEDVQIFLYEGLGYLPLFNPDIEDENLKGSTPKKVSEFRSMIMSADGILVASPEYAHGITGVMKNALDWIVGSGEICGKPIALFNTSPRANIALAALKEVMRTMDGHIIEQASLILPLLGANLDEQAIVSHTTISQGIKRTLKIFVDNIRRIDSIDNG